MSKMEGNLTGLIWGKYNGKGGLVQVTNSAGPALSLRVFSEILRKLASSDICLKKLQSALLVLRTIHLIRFIPGGHIAGIQPKLN